MGGVVFVRRASGLVRELEWWAVAGVVPSNAGLVSLAHVLTNSVYDFSIALILAVILWTWRLRITRERMHRW